MKRILFLVLLFCSSLQAQQLLRSPITAGAAGTLLSGQGIGTLPSFSATPTLGIAASVTGQLKFANATGSNVITLAAPASPSAYTLTLPPDGGTVSYLLRTDGSGTATWVAPPVGTFSNIVETLNSSAPNATVKVEQLAVSGASTSTNNDLSLVPKGTGALLAATPDNATAGGNKRGANAVDLQTNRGAATDVASGSYSTIVGGQSNTSSGDYSVTGGFGNIASGSLSVAFGQSNSAANTASFAFGYNLTVSQTYSMGIGRGLTLSNTGNFGFLGGNAGSNDMTIATDNVATFGNVDLWLANNTNTASALRFYAPYNTSGAFPNGTKYVGFKAGVVTTTQIWTLPLADGGASQFLQTNGSGVLSWADVSVAHGGTGLTTITAHGVMVGEGTSNVAATAAGSTGQWLKSQGASADPIWSTATLAEPGASGKHLKSDGTNWTASTETFAAPSANKGDALVGDGTNWTSQPTGWISTKVAGSDFTRTAQTLADITGLTFTAAASTTYEIEAFLDVTSSTTAGVQFAVNSTGTSPTVMFISVAGAGSASVFTTVTTGVSANGTAGTAQITSSTAEALVHIWGIVKSGTGSPTISIQGLKTTSGTLTVKIGSKLMYRVQ